jgi:hypothetical protein
MTIVASSREEPKEVLEARHDEIRSIAASDDLKDFVCGHRGPRFYDMDLYGQVLHNNGTSPEKCGQCCVKWFQTGTCRCARCGLIIFPGDPVALYGPSADFKPERVTEVPSGVIGCLRWDCCPSGGFFAGHWTGKDFCPAFSNGRSAVEECFATGQIVVGNIGDDVAPKWYQRLWRFLRGR